MNTSESQKNNSFTREHVDEVLNSLSSHIAIINECGVIVSVNNTWKNYTKINGINEPNFGIGILYTEYSSKAKGISIEYKDRLSNAIKEVLEGKMNHFRMVYPIHAYAEEQWYKVVVTPLKSATINGAVISHRDISDIVRMSEKLQRSEESYQYLFEQASDGIFISDQNLKFLEVNNTASVQLGYSKEELLSMSIPQLFQSDYLYNDPLKISELQMGQHIIKERTFKRKDGTFLDVEINSKQLPNGNFLSISRDLSERRQSEMLLANKENYIRTVLDSDPECIKLLTYQGICLEMNLAGLKIVEAVTADQVIGKQIMNLIDEPFKENAFNVLKKVFAGISGQIEYRLTTFNGVKKWMEANAVPFKNATGEIESCLWISRDITDRVKDREALQKSHTRLKKNFTKIQNIIEKERKEISRELHDELGQKLTALNFDLAWLQKRLSPKEKEEKALMVEMTSLVDSLMFTVQNISKSLRPPLLEYFNLADAVDWLVSDFQKRTKIKCEVSIDVGKSDFTEDLKVTIFRILQESLTNIIRHANAELVKIKLALIDGQIKLLISDDGKGITDDNINDLNSFGIHGMQERVESLNGSFKITGVPGRGTKILTEIPVLNEK
ncbi:MAG TPA: PAS domain S-box protein [Bacteroidia bacterium]|nr:PAS domain S-box protein [Bacteroidia bacterium]HNS13245.1 PAS domain S-box protein [Bacteroidia bacterium]